MPHLEMDWNINACYKPYVNDERRIQILFGGSSSGKSKFVAQRLVMDLFKGGRNYLVARNTGRSHRESTYSEISKVINEWGLRSLFRVSKSDLSVICHNGYSALFRGLDDVEKVKSLSPPKGDLTDIWIEEATEVSYDSYKQLTKRLRGLTDGIAKRITFTFNPIRRTHWICKEFFAGFNDDDREYNDEGISILRTTHLDNRFLDPADRKALEDETNEYYYNVYTLGKWGVLGHLIFTNWKTQNLTGFRDALSSYHNGLDFGYTNDPTAFNRMSITGNKLYITHEMHEYGMSDKLIAETLKPVIQDEVLRCDPSAPRDIAELRGYGLNAISAKAGPGSVNWGIQFIQQHEVIIHHELQNTINEFQMYQWDKNKDGEVMNIPVDKNNHHIDNIRYALSGVSFLAKTPEGKFDRRAIGLRM